jgi:hypothetical protein
MVSAPELNLPWTVKQAATIFGFPLHFGGLAEWACELPETTIQATNIGQIFMPVMFSWSITGQPVPIP